jgi:hypothetical protein
MYFGTSLEQKRQKVHRNNSTTGRMGAEDEKSLRK